MTPEQLDKIEEILNIMGDTIFDLKSDLENKEMIELLKDCMADINEELEDV